MNNEWIMEIDGLIDYDGPDDYEWILDYEWTNGFMNSNKDMDCLRSSLLYYDIGLL